MANLIISSPNIEAEFSLNRGQTLIKLLTEYSNLVEFALRIQLTDNDESHKHSNKTNDLNIEEEANEKEDQNQLGLDETDDLKVLIKHVENLIECKQISIDLIKTICSFFIDEGKYI